MKNVDSYKEVMFLLASVVVALVVFINIINDFSKTRALENSLVEAIDPAKDLQSLDNYVTYILPEGWKKEDQVDIESGSNTLISLTSPDFESQEASVSGGVRIIIDRIYHPNPEATLNTKLNAQYPIYDYNIRPIKIGDKNAMTMHEDYETHNRFIYVAVGSHLWQISVTSKSLEDEEKYQEAIENFLNSIKFKG